MSIPSPTCIRCDKRLENVTDGAFQPYDGLAFHTRGHYGSTYFDPLDGSYLRLAICDACVKVVDEKGYVEHGDPNPEYAW